MPFALLSILGGVRSGLTAAFGFLAKLNPWQLACLAFAIFALVQHFEIIHARHEAAKWEKQYTELRHNFDGAVAEIGKADAQIAQLAKLLREANDAQETRILADANALRLSGPGKSACRPATPAAPRQPVAPGARPDATGPSLPPDNRSAVPWGWLTTRAQEHDQLRAEVQSWRDWYQVLVKNWPVPNMPTNSGQPAREDHK